MYDLPFPSLSLSLPLPSSSPAPLSLLPPTPPFFRLYSGDRMRPILCTHTHTCTYSYAHTHTHTPQLYLTICLCVYMYKYAPHMYTLQNCPIVHKPTHGSYLYTRVCVPVCVCTCVRVYVCVYYIIQTLYLHGKPHTLLLTLTPLTFTISSHQKVT